MGDLVERLRATGGKGQGGPLKAEAADRIAELEAENARLRYVVEAARPFPKLLRGVRDSDIRDAVTTLYDRLTLSEKEPGDADT